MRAIPTRVLAVVGLSASLLLAGCGGDSPTASESAAPSTAVSASPSATASATPSATPTVTASSNFDAVTVTGDYGKAPKVKVDTPWAIDQTRTKVLKDSDGTTVAEGGTVTVDYYGVDGRTGKKFDDSYSRGQAATFSLAQVVPGFSKGLTGQKVGSRVLIAMPGSDGYDASGGNAQAGIEVGDTLIFVVDILATTLDGPAGETVTPPSGLPTVTGALDKPEITIPKTDPPTKLVVQPLIKGTGAKVAEGDSVTVDYRWQRWSDGSLVEQTYGAEPQSAQLSAMVAGFRDGLVGQTVGSRVLLVIPPAQSYPDGNANPKIDADETQVMVVDILFAQAAQ